MGGWNSNNLKLHNVKPPLAERGQREEEFGEVKRKGMIVSVFSCSRAVRQSVSRVLRAIRVVASVGRWDSRAVRGSLELLSESQSLGYWFLYRRSSAVIHR